MVTLANFLDIGRGGAVSKGISNFLKVLPSLSPSSSAHLHLFSLSGILGPSNNVGPIGVDADGNIWVGTGVARCEVR
jgi:hypothetical protein